LGVRWVATYGICYGEFETLDFAHSGIVREWVDYWGGISVCFVHKEVEAMVY